MPRDSNPNLKRERGRGQPQDKDALQDALWDAPVYNTIQYTATNVRRSCGPRDSYNTIRGDERGDVTFLRAKGFQPEPEA